MKVEWTRGALDDLARLHDFLAPVNALAAANAIRVLATAPARLSEHPRIGEKLGEFAPHEVRRIVVGKYEIRYEIKDAALYVLRLWHTREDR